MKKVGEKEERIQNERGRQEEKEGWREKGEVSGKEHCPEPLTKADVISNHP